MIGISTARSRQKARKKVKEIYPDLSHYEVVHHLNHNPFDNRFENLVVMEIGDHTSYHLTGSGLSKRNLLKALDKLERLIFLYNEGFGYLL